MQTIRFPDRSEWAELVKRPVQAQAEIEQLVLPILEQVKSAGDDALRFYARKFDGVEIEALQVSEAELAEAADRISDELKTAIQTAKQNIEVFHRAQKQDPEVIETMPGVRCWRKPVGIEKVGLYIPGGTAPLFSTVLMLAIPAALAGCNEIVLCSPTGKDGRIHPATLYAAQLCGVTKLFKTGGAQAIAAMAYGTESVPQVYKIFGPGNQYVTMAKQLVNKEGIAIDMPAGPSEVLVIADAQANPAYVAADLLSQAEHGADSQVILLTDNEQILQAVAAEVQAQLQTLPRMDFAEKALQHSKLILMPALDDCMELSNRYAPEHLILQTENAEQLAEKVVNAGSVFIGPYACESAGDYASGTNHTLPTNGFATAYSGVSLDSFVKKITFQTITKAGLEKLGPVIEIMAEAEQLLAHKQAVSIRLNRGEL